MKGDEQALSFHAYHWSSIIVKTGILSILQEEFRHWQS